MIVVLIIGNLAMMSWVALSRINLRARTSTYQNDCRVFSAAFTQYAQEKGNYPADGGPHFLPAVMAPYVNRTQWLRVTPFGGYYDWDNIDSWSGFPARIKAAVSISGCTLPLAQLQQIDRWVDDGNITTGSFRVTNAGATVIHVIEP